MHNASLQMLIVFKDQGKEVIYYIPFLLGVTLVEETFKLYRQ